MVFVSCCSKTLNVALLCVFAPLLFCLKRLFTRAAIQRAFYFSGGQPLDCSVCNWLNSVVFILENKYDADL